MEDKKKLTVENKIKIAVAVGAVVLWSSICFKCSVRDTNQNMARGMNKLFKVNPKLENDLWDAFVEVKKRKL